MTYVEFFDRTAVENISTCLTAATFPGRVIHIGTNSKVMEVHKQRYLKVLEERGCSVEFIVEPIMAGDLEGAKRRITDIVETYDDCVFDITGGQEILLLALGIVYAENPDKNIQIHRFNLRNNVLADCDMDGKTVFHDLPALSIEENVRIYGGEVVYGEVHEDKKTYRWDLTADFVEDIGLMWGICKDDVRFWNTQIGVFSALEEVGETSEDRLTTTARLSVLKAHLERNDGKYVYAKGIVGGLLRYGLLTAFSAEDGETVTVSYKNEQVKRCLTKAGQALEMKTLLAVRELTDKKGTIFYDDVLNGAVIDWDGVILEQTEEEGEKPSTDTRNEIDILAMHGVIPTFISCKNGKVDANELYKLNTVAERFGGAYAKKVLVTTALEFLRDKGESLRLRAKEMDIKVIDGVQDFDDATFAKELRRAWSN